MKKYILFFYAMIFTQFIFAQGDSTKAPYLRFPNFPPVKLLLPDSSSYFTKDNLPKKSAVMLMLFNPQCDHCQHLTEEIIQNIDKFKNIQIIMATSMPFSSMKDFREKYRLAAYENITVSQDTHHFLPSYFMIHNLPFLAFYNKKKELISVSQGSMPMEKVLEELKK